MQNSFWLVRFWIFVLEERLETDGNLEEVEIGEALKSLLRESRTRSCLYIVPGKLN